MTDEISPNYYRILHERGEDGTLLITGREAVAGLGTHRAGIRVDLTTPARHDLPPVEGRFSAEARDTQPPATG